MKLLDRYVHDVTRRLPEKQRKDVALELTAEISEMVDAQPKGKSPTKKQVYDVLTQLGNPSRLAERYRDNPRYLISPEYYELYISLLKLMCLIIIPLIVFIAWMSQVMSVNHTVLSLMGVLIGVTLEATVHVVFWSTLSFVVVQKLNKLPAEDEDWTPDDLPELPAASAISRSDSYMAIVWSVFAIIATLYQVPVVYDFLSPDDVPQFFAPGMWPGWTLGLFVISILGLIAELIKLRVGGWNKLTTTAIVVLNSLAIVFFLSALYFVYPIANPEISKIIAESLDRPNAAQSIQIGIQIFVYVIVALNVWEISEAIIKYRKGGKR